MQKSSSHKYIEAFTSDIFNRFGKKDKHEKTKQYRPTHAPSLQRTSSDIFNRDFDINHTQDQPHHHKRGIKTFSMSSDIFNLKHSNDNNNNNNKRTIKKDPSLRNTSNRSTAFSHYQDKDYIIKRRDTESTYNPDNYINTQTPYQRQLNEFHNNSNNSHILSNTKHSNFKGCFVKDQQQINNSERSNASITTPNKKRFRWVQYNSTITNSDNAIKVNNIAQTQPNNTKIRKLLEMQSDIFNVPHKEKQNEKAYDNLLIEKESRNYNINNNNTQPNLTINTNHSKPNQLQVPPYKMDWKTINTEKYFTKYNDNKAEKLSAYDRWQICFTESEGNTISNHHTRTFPKKLKSETKNDLNNIKKPDINSIKTLLQTTKEDKARKYLEGVPYYSNNPSYYGSSLTSPKNNENEHLFTIKPNDNTVSQLDDFSIRKLLFNEGIHAYDIKTQRSNVLGHNNDNAITFKVRENDSKGFEEKIQEVKRKLERTENVTVEPVEKITVNRKKNVPNKITSMKPKLVYPDGDNTRNKVVRMDLQNKSNRFSNDFMQINNSYKNPKVRENYNKNIKKE